MQHISGVALQGAIKTTMTVHHNETEAVIILQELIQSLGVEFVVAEIERCVDWLERFEVDVHLSLLAIVGNNCTTIEHQAIVWHSIVQLQALLGGSDGAQHRKTRIQILSPRETLGRAQ